MLIFVNQGVRVMVFNATLNNISVISWWSVLLVRKPEYPEKTTDGGFQSNLPRQIQNCPCCNSVEMEDEYHFFFKMFITLLASREEKNSVLLVKETRVPGENCQKSLTNFIR